MTSTYSNDAAIERTLDAILARLDQLVPQQRSKDIGPDTAPATNGHGTAPAVPAPASAPATTYPTYPSGNEQWIVPVSALLMKAVVKAAPGIVRDTVTQNRDLFEDLGALGGAFLGGHDGSVAAGHLGHMVDSVVQDVGVAIMDGIDGFFGLFKGVKDLPRGEADLQARFVMPFLSSILPQLVQALPPLVGSLTKGYRDVPPTVTDGDAIARWFGPLFQNLVPQLVNVVPDILSVFAGPRP